MSSSRPAHLLTPIFSLTLLLSAFLLFLVQPMFGKMILPLLGGSPSVWNTAMLFFQVLLLAGYAYAHALARLRKPMWQAAVHIALLFLFTTTLPVMVPKGWSPPVTGDPVFWQLALMTVAAGGPFFILSASAPLLQNWFSLTGHKDAHNPYFLYTASNIGSVAALLLYPFVIEPKLNLGMQSGYWMLGYWFLLIMVSLCGLLSIRRDQVITEQPAAIVLDPENIEEPITWRRRMTWLLLAFVPSSLMLGVTTFITTDLASVPLIWIVPLALYVCTFIIAFARKPILGRRETEMMQGVVMIFLLGVLGSYCGLSMPFMMFIHLTVFFFTALMCHHELAALRPSARHLTQFYLLMSLGGALGGAFNALLAPRLFLIPVEYAIVLAVSGFLRMAASGDQSLSRAFAKLAEAKSRGIGPLIKASGLPFIVFISLICAATYTFILHTSAQWMAMIALVWTLPALLSRRFVFALCALLILCFHPPGYIWNGLQDNHVIRRERNFFGILRVIDKETRPDRAGAEPVPIRTLVHGTTLHGVQARNPEYRAVPISYYSEFSGIAEAFKLIDGYKGGQKIGVFGLGVGATACYPHPGRHFDFFEIDPAVAEIAQNPAYFTFLRDCGSPYDIVPGDARLTIAGKPDKTYDLLLLDAFSSDNIPIHLLTAEAMRLYKSKLSDRGILVVHISNQYLNLQPVVAAAAKEIGMMSYDRKIDSGRLEKSNLPYNSTDYVLLTRDEKQGAALEKTGWVKISPSPDVKLWTDQFSNIVSVLRFGKRKVPLPGTTP